MIGEERMGAAIDRDGYGLIQGLLTPQACRDIAGMYDGDGFRSTITMSRHGFGRGEYRYFDYPLPGEVQHLRESLYSPLARIASSWSMRLGDGHAWPERHADLTGRCVAAGQTRPTPLLLRYGPGDHNRLHQDVYGELLFPLQVVVLLSDPEQDFTGGELVLVEGRARMQSKPIVVPLSQGDAAIIPVRERPISSTRGWARATMRHGVAEVRSGERHTLGIIFHDAA